jgi:DNA-directed RNA polymerase omega subunit
MDDLIKGDEKSIYKLVIAASRRALELGAGSEKLVNTAPNAKPTSIALKEIKENKVSYKEKKK